jgi:hypothetical protein
MDAPLVMAAADILHPLSSQVDACPQAKLAYFRLW